MSQASRQRPTMRGRISQPPFGEAADRQGVQDVQSDKNSLPKHGRGDELLQLSPERRQYVDQLLADNYEWVVRYGARCARGSSLEELKDEGLGLISQVWLEAYKTLSRYPNDKPLPGPDTVNRNAWFRMIARNVVNQSFRDFYHRKVRGSSSQNAGSDASLEEVIASVEGPVPYDDEADFGSAEVKMWEIGDDGRQEEQIVDHLDARNSLHRIWSQLDSKEKLAIYMEFRDFVEEAFPEEAIVLESLARKSTWNRNALYQAVYRVRQRVAVLKDMAHV